MATTQNGIYYQNNYNAAADVPADMKKMAVSIDEIVEETKGVQEQQGASIEQISGNVSNLSKEQTTMKKNIEDIQEEKQQQDTNIQKMQEQIDKNTAEIVELEEDVKANSIIVTTEEATSLQVNDANGSRAKLSVKGNYRQQTREGYNLLNVPTECEIVKNFKKVAGIFEAGAYTIKATSVTTDNDEIQRFLLAFEDETGATFGQSFLYKTTLKTTVQLAKKAKTVRIYSADDWNNTSVTTTTFKELIIYSGTDEKSYEAYGKAPSRKFPTEVETVCEKINIKKYNEEDEERYVLDVQQKMLTGDYFDLERKKEVHTWNILELTGNESWTTEGELEKIIRMRIGTGKTSNSYLGKCTHFDFIGNYNLDEEHCYASSAGTLYIFIDKTVASTTEEFKTFLAGQATAGTPVKVYWKSDKTTELDLTETQIEQLEQLNKLRTYKEQTNIVTVEDLALMQLEYSQDIKAYIDSKIS